MMCNNVKINLRKNKIFLQGVTAKDYSSYPDDSESELPPTA